MDITKLVSSLHPLERKVLPVLKSVSDVPGIVEKTGMQDVEVLRAFQWLQAKDLILLTEDSLETVELDKNGQAYAKEGLPERRFLQALVKGPMTIDKIPLSQEERQICMGLLRQKALIDIKKDKELTATLTDAGKKSLDKPLLEELFLKKKFPIQLSSLAPEEKFALDNLKRRKEIIKVVARKIFKASLTDLGKQVLSKGISDTVVEKITPDMMLSGSWKGKEFRRYDVNSKAPRAIAGKLHPYRSFHDDVRRKFISLGFKEMTGPLVESEFWDMDALFMPQFHSARDIHDAYYLKNPKFAKIDEKILKQVKEVHETGGKTGSKGWRYEFDVQRTKRTLLRTQGTACSARMLASKDLQVPGKYFGITRCFRYDVIDATHLADFNQVEGIVVDENLTIRHLFGLLRTFAKVFAGTDEIKLVPGYFPFTEPSVEVYAKHPQLGWVELGGAGIFRPEVVDPLTGKKVSVIAWGLGIDRLGMFTLGIKDIRDLFSRDLSFLRNSRLM